MEKFEIDTRSYDRSQFVDTLVEAATGPGADVSAQDIVDYINGNFEIVNYDGSAVDASKYLADIAKVIAK